MIVQFTYTKKRHKYYSIRGEHLLEIHSTTMYRVFKYCRKKFAYCNNGQAWNGARPGISFRTTMQIYTPLNNCSNNHTLN